MPRKATGSLSVLKDAKGKKYFRGRIRLADGSQEWIDPPAGMTEARAREWVASMQEKETRGGFLLARKRGEDVTASGETFAAYVERRAKARAAAAKENANDEAAIVRKHAGPLLAPLPIASIGRASLEDVRDSLDRKVREGALAWKTAFNVWGYLGSLFADARDAKDRGLRVRDDNPTDGIRGPDRGAEKQKAYLYPNEFLQLVSCEDVPLRWRRSIAIAVYLYARAGELHALEFGGALDVERGIVEITEQIDRDTATRRETKTKSSRRFAFEAELLPLLRTMSAEADGVGRLMPIDATDRKLSLKLARCMRIAGLTRRALYERGPTAKPLSWHDLRSTGITWCAVRGDDPLRIKQRAGHRSFSTTERYIVEAENIRDGFGTVFPPLPEALSVQDKFRDNYWTEQIRKPENKASCVVEAPGIENGSAGPIGEITARKHRIGRPRKVRLTDAKPANPGSFETGSSQANVPSAGPADASPAPARKRRS